MVTDWRKPIVHKACELLEQRREHHACIALKYVHNYETKRIDKPGGLICAEEFAHFYGKFNGDDWLPDYQPASEEATQIRILWLLLYLEAHTAVL